LISDHIMFWISYWPAKGYNILKDVTFKFCKGLKNLIIATF